MPGLSAVLIVRDEEQHLAACLESVRELVDEIVVVDTGSEDRSLEIAREFGARVHLEPWREDFAFARNTGLERARGDWILYIDADERIEATGDVQAALANPLAVGATVGFHAKRELTAYPELRFFRRRDDIRFRGAIHETIRPDVDAAVARGESIIEAPATIRHLGYEGDRQAKFARDLPLLERAVQDQPERLYLWRALGEGQLGLGLVEEAERSWRKGLAVARGEEPIDLHVLVYADLFGLHFDEGAVEMDDCAELVEESVRRHGDDPLVAWFHARHLAATGQRARARDVLERLQTMRPDTPQGRTIGYDRRLFEGYAWALMGSCWLADGDAARALEWLERAQSDCPENVEVQTKLALARAMVIDSGRVPPTDG